MTPEVSPIPTNPPWRKAIPEARDRLQSKILVGIALPILCYLVADTRFLDFTHHQDFVYLRSSAIVSVAFGFFAWRLKAATPLAAISGTLICFLIAEYTGYRESFIRFGGESVFHSGLSPLILLFILTFSATRFRRDRKAAKGLEENRKGRTASQIIANLGMAGLLSSYFGLMLIGPGSITGSRLTVLHSLVSLHIPMLAALAEASADTVSSEIGQALKGKTILITTLRVVEPGTDGAISLVGTIAGIVAAALIAATGIPALDLSLLGCVNAWLAAVVGLFFDSLIGATIERQGWLGNDLVNFTSTVVSVAAALYAYRFWPYWG